MGREFTFADAGSAEWGMSNPGAHYAALRLRLCRDAAKLLPVKRCSWLRGVCAWVLASGSLGCQGNYPLEPTLCDDWCDAKDQVRCGDWLDDPAGCVVICEQQLSSNSACASALEAHVECLRNTPPGNGYCTDQPCTTQLADFYACAPSTRE